VETKGNTHPYFRKREDNLSCCLIYALQRLRKPINIVNMNKKKLEHIHWLLMVSRRNLDYASQRAKYNEILSDFRKANKGLYAVTDLLGEPLSLTEGVYQD
jgi:hypothetical protein